jgi:hypothetical protein
MSDGFFVNGFVWLIIIGLALALLVIAGAPLWSAPQRWLPGPMGS